MSVRSSTLVVALLTYGIGCSSDAAPPVAVAGSQSGGATVLQADEGAGTQSPNPGNGGQTISNNSGETVGGSLVVVGGGGAGMGAIRPDGGGGAPSPTTEEPAARSGPPLHVELILYDDDGKLWYVNNANPELGWSVESGSGRDLQLIGGGRVMLGKSSGWAEYQLSDGSMVGGRTGFPGVQSAHRLADGTTMLATLANGNILLQMVTAAGDVVRTITYEGYDYVRLVRPTAAGTFLVTNDDLVFEGSAEGDVLRSWQLEGSGRHVWKAMRLNNGNTVIASGYNATLEVFGPDQALLATIGGKTPELDALDPHFFADFHVMPNGDYFLVNSQADSSNPDSVQLLQFNSAGELVWQQKQPNGVRSLEAAIVLDGVDTSKLHIEPEGVLIPAR